MGNVLGAVRLSRMTDESTSPECQRDQMRTCARLHGHQVVQITEHTDGIASGDALITAVAEVLDNLADRVRACFYQ